MRETIARALLLTSRIFAGLAVMTDARYVAEESDREVRKLMAKATPIYHEAAHVMKLDKEEQWNVGQYL